MSVIDQIGFPNNKTRVDHSNGSNGDIINTIHKNFPAAVSETKNVAGSFKGNSHLETAHRIWDFLRTKIKYKVDPSGVQKIRLPKRFLNDRTGDCKSFSLFTAGILRNLGMPVIFRYASYSASTTPGHVYVVTKDEKGNNIIIDGVWNRFDDEKTPNHKTDYTMRIETLSGIGKKPKRKLKDIIKGVVGVVKKVNPVFVLGRNSFLGLIRLNVRGFATRLAASIAKNPAVVKNVWATDLGGDYNSLVSAVNAGKTKKAFIPPKNIRGIGLDPATIAAITAAAPIILIVVSKILKPLGQGNDPAIDDAVSEAGAALEDEVDEDEIANVAKNGLKNKSASFCGFDYTSPIECINMALKAAITLTGASLIF